MQSALDEGGIDESIDHWMRKLRNSVRTPPSDHRFEIIGIGLTVLVAVKKVLEEIEQIKIQLDT